jgi:hypothetical protein
VEEMRTAIENIQDPRTQKRLRARGLEHAQSFCWVNMARELKNGLITLVDESSDERYRLFFEHWQALRRAQARFDQFN